MMYEIYRINYTMNDQRSGLFTSCIVCSGIRKDKGSWSHSSVWFIDDNTQLHSDVPFWSSIDCPLVPNTNISCRRIFTIETQYMCMC